jgi:folate-binding protein YgfZ
MNLATPLRELHQKAGAALGVYFGCHLPAHFGDAEREYRLAREAVALLDTNYQAFFWMKGPDRVRYLNAVTTPDVKSLQAGQGTLGLLLNAQGHILAELRVLALPDRFLITCHAIASERTHETLEKLIIMDDVTLEPVSAKLGSLALEGPLAPRVAYEMCGIKLEAMEMHSHREVELGAIPCGAVRTPRYGQPGLELICDREKLPALWGLLGDAARAAGGAPAGWDAVNALRMEAGVPWFGHDFDDKVIPHEAGLEHSHISYTKGCYTGQEIVERVRSRGQVNRRLTGVKFSAAAPPAPGAKLLADGKEVGHVTSAAFSPAADAPIGFAYLRRERHAPGSRLSVQENGEAEVITLPFSLNPTE